MKRQKVTSFEVICPNCEVSLGKVTEVEEKTRPGFFSNVSEPQDIPGRCPECDGFLARVPNHF